jgi:hypothetical protein
MAHFAKLDSNNIVTFVTVGRDEDNELELSARTGDVYKKTSFNTVPELMDYFINSLKVSRILKRKLIITDYWIKTIKIKLSDYILIDELLRYTSVLETNNFLSSKAFTISSKELEIDEIPLSLIKKMTHIDNYELINIDIAINCDLPKDVDEYTLYNVIQLRDELNYKIEEYIVENNIDLSKIAICHDNLTYELFSEESKKEMNIIKYDDLYNFDNQILNEFLRLFTSFISLQYIINLFYRQKVFFYYIDYKNGAESGYTPPFTFSKIAVVIEFCTISKRSI